MKVIQFFFYILFVLLISNCSNNGTITSAKDFAKEFHENNPGFYANHFNNVITLKGKVVEIGESNNLPDNYFVKLLGYKTERGNVNVLCYFSSIDQIKNLKLGESLIIGGVCKLSDECKYSRCYPAIFRCKVLKNGEVYLIKKGLRKNFKKYDIPNETVKPYIQLYNDLKANGVQGLPNTVGEFKTKLLTNDKALLSSLGAARKLQLDVAQYDIENLAILREQLGLVDKGENNRNQLKPYEKLYENLKSNGVQGLPNTVHEFKSILLKNDKALYSAIGIAAKLGLDTPQEIENTAVLREQLGLVDKEVKRGNILFNTYSSKKYNYYISIPSNFKQEKGKGPHIDLIFVNKDGSSISTNISDRMKEEFNFTAHDYNKEMFLPLFSSINAEEKTIVAKQKAYIYEAEKIDSKLKFICCYLFYKDKAIVITCSSEKSKFNQYRELFRKSIFSYTYEK
ncbi:MAG: hypothetical protein K1X81_06625 [Bacteroidia bacterium]|nr:hypothetical protein [Bacteroidia bacterium]